MWSIKTCEYQGIVTQRVAKNKEIINNNNNVIYYYTNFMFGLLALLFRYNNANKDIQDKAIQWILSGELVGNEGQQLTYVETFTNERKRHSIIQLHDCVSFYI